jgi:cytochrome c-type biogenesis protein CcmH
MRIPVRISTLVIAFLLAIGVAASPTFAVLPDEMLDDQVLEARARAISKEVRCLVCRNESIDESNADLARDLRILVRERLVAGDSNPQVKQFLVDRYGEFVLLKPRFSAANAALWFSGPIAFLIGLFAVIVFLRSHRRAAAASEAPLSDEEKKRVAEILEG